MQTKRVLKKVSTPFEMCEATASILMVNLVDPQISTMKVFLDAIKSNRLPCLIVGNKSDMMDEGRCDRVAGRLKEPMLKASMKTGEGLEDIKSFLDGLKEGSRVVVLGVFNSGKTSLIAKLTGKELKIGDLPGTTLEFTEHDYQKKVLIDTVGQVIDINKPMMVSIDFSGCKTPEEKAMQVFKEEQKGLVDTSAICVPYLVKAAKTIINRVDKGGKIIVTGAGASALVAMEMAGQGQETGLKIYPITNNLASAQPISFAKGTAEEDMALAKYIDGMVNQSDVLIGISASGGTGFVYDALRRAKAKGALCISITENVDTPVGKNSDIVIKSSAKPEGPSSSKIQTAHLVIGHALMLLIADERGISADRSINFMLPEIVETKKMGIK